jgi:hypothetical protein
LIAIPGSPGSPGIGKSSFLANFPASEAYQNYTRDVRVIVSALTFNSAMSQKYNRLGLRVIYGAIQSMCGKSN